MLANHPFTITEKCVTEDKVPEVVKGHTVFLTARWTKLSAFWKALEGQALKGHSPIVCCLHVNSITPPFLNTVQANCTIFWVLQSKEDDEATDYITSLNQSSSQHI